jgi:hypothetical protein
MEVRLYFSVNALKNGQDGEFFTPENKEKVD